MGVPGWSHCSEPCRWAKDEGESSERVAQSTKGASLGARDGMEKDEQVGKGRKKAAA
jgi:hypothetical protein